MSFKERVEEAMSGSKTVVAFCNCEITYSGRAETFLPKGDRVLVIKADGSLLVHQPQGSTPVNYMKAGTSITFETVDDHQILHAKHEKEKAWLDIAVFTVYETVAKVLMDGETLQLSGNEKDMADYIRDHPETISKSFKPVSREEQTDVGFIDVFGHNGSGRLVVVECKRVTASLSAVDQLRRYVRRVKQIKGTDDVSGVLAAPSITPNAREMLEQWGFTYCHVEPPKRLERWQKDQQRLVDF